MKINQPSSILFISNAFSVGDAYGAVCKELAIQLKSKGWKVTTTSALPSRLLRPLDMFATIWSARHQYVLAQIDVFSGPAFRWAEVASWEIRRLKKPYILSLHGGNLPVFSEQYPDRVRALLTAADFVVTPSHYLFEKMQTFHSDIRLIPNPISIQPYQFRLRYSPSPRLLFLRALHKIYNPSLAVYVLHNLLQTHPNAHLTIVGPDKGDGAGEELRVAIKKTGLHNKVTVTGALPKSEIPNIMSSSDIFLNTTNIDNTPISVMEAMASGLCIVSTNVGGIPYLLSHAYNALLVPPKDAEAMADAIRRVLAEPGLARKLSQNARNDAEKFDWSVVLPIWEALLSNAIENHKA